VRGLKLKRAEDVGRGLLRRTFTGAWIETKVQLTRDHSAGSRTFTGAWIETLEYRYVAAYHCRRTFTGAWIETGQLIIQDDE